MNYYQDVLMAEFNRQRIHEEFKQIRLEQLAIKSQVYRPRRFEKLMFNFADWMISTGQRLRQRYENTAVNYNNSPSEGLIH
jgi:hypothetical protein